MSRLGYNSRYRTKIQEAKSRYRDFLSLTLTTIADVKERLNCVGLAVSGRRHKLGLTLEEIATRAQILGWDVDKKILSRIESGTRRVIDAEAYYLAVTLKCSIPDLYPSRNQMDAEFLRVNPPKRKR